MRRVSYGHRKSRRPKVCVCDAPTPPPPPPVEETPRQTEPDWMTSNTDPAPWVASADVEASPAYKAFASFNASYWEAFPGPLPHWIKLDRGASAATIVTDYGFGTYGLTDPTYSPKDWILEGSNDDATWDVLDTRAGFTAYTNDRSWFQLTTPSAHRYLRITVTATVSGTADLVIAALIFITQQPPPP